MLRILHETDLPDLLIIENLTQLAPWSSDVFDRCWRAGYTGWVIEIENKVIGFILASMHAGETHILNLCVHPDFQHQGHGRKLLTHAVGVAKERTHGIAFLEVRRSNLHAIDLYKKEGFIQIGERMSYYPMHQGVKEDALVFAKDLGVK